MNDPATNGGTMDYRERILNRLYRAACAAQNEGRWEAADTFLSIGYRYETLWASLDERR